MDSLVTVGENIGMKINIDKTKLMKVTQSEGDELNIKISGKELEQLKIWSMQLYGSETSAKQKKGCV